jgi:hypothetical protein
MLTANESEDAAFETDNSDLDNRSLLKLILHHEYFFLAPTILTKTHACKLEMLSLTKCNQISLTFYKNLSFFIDFTDVLPVCNSILVLNLKDYQLWLKVQNLVPFDDNELVIACLTSADFGINI